MIIKSNSALHLTIKHSSEIFHTLHTEQRQENSHKCKTITQKKGRKYNSKLWISLTPFHYQPSQWRMPQRKGQHHIIETCWCWGFFEGCTCIVSMGRFFISLYLPLTLCNCILHAGLGLSVLHVLCTFIVLFLEFIHGIFPYTNTSERSHWATSFICIIL